MFFFRLIFVLGRLLRKIKFCVGMLGTQKFSTLTTENSLKMHANHDKSIEMYFDLHLL